MSTSVAELAAKLEKAGSNIKKAEREVVKRSAMFAKDAMLAGAESVKTPKHLRTSKGSAAANAYGAKYLLTNGSPPTAVVFLRGAPPYWRERGIQAHLIGPKKVSRLGKRFEGDSRYEAALWLPDGNFYSLVRHPGVSARPFWGATKETIHVGAGRIHKAASTEALLKAGFRGG